MEEKMNTLMVKEGEITKEGIDLIRKTVAKDANDLELQMFLHLAQRYGLDAFSREIMFIKRKVYNSYKQSYDEIPTFLVGRDGFLSIAHRSGQFGGIKTTPDFDEKGNLVSATCKIWNKSCPEPIEVTVYLKEYCAYNKDGKPQALWGTKPITMLSKVAESQALRKAFNFHGVYSPEEMEAEMQKDPQTELGYLKETIKTSEKIHSSPESYDEWSQQIKTDILDDIQSAETAQQLSHVKKQYETDMGRLMDEDRNFIQSEFDNKFQHLVSDEQEPEIQPDGKAIDRKTGQWVELGPEVEPEGAQGPKQGTFDDLVAKEAFG